MHCHSVSALLILNFSLPVSYCVGTLGTHTEIKRVAEEKVTLPCHHQLGLPETDTLDIEWLLTDNEGGQKEVSIHVGRVPPLPVLHLHSSVSQSLALDLRELQLFSSGLCLKDFSFKYKTTGYLGCWDNILCFLGKPEQPESYLAQAWEVNLVY